MWVKTPNGLVNLAQFDEVKVKRAHRRDDYEFVLVAWKHVSDSEDFGWSEPVLCGGSKEHCEAMLQYLADKINDFTISNGDPKPDHEPEPDMGYSLLDEDPGPDELYF